MSVGQDGEQLAHIFEAITKGTRACNYNSRSRSKLSLR